MDELISYDIRDRGLVISTEQDGFNFYDDKKFLYRIFSIKNKSRNDIHFIKIDVNSELTTISNATVKDNYSSFINLLRSNEEIVFRIHNIEQRNKLCDELDNNRQVESRFSCIISYITKAKEQICYRFESKIKHIPGKSVCKKELTIDDAKIIIVKDEYKVLGKFNMVSHVYSRVENTI